MVRIKASIHDMVSICWQLGVVFLSIPKNNFLLDHKFLVSFTKSRGRPIFLSAEEFSKLCGGRGFLEREKRNSSQKCSATSFFVFIILLLFPLCIEVEDYLYVSKLFRGYLNNFQILIRIRKIVKCNIPSK